jgi:hypothetical protein
MHSLTLSGRMLNNRSSQEGGEQQALDHCLHSFSLVDVRFL